MFGMRSCPIHGSGMNPMFGGGMPLMGGGMPFGGGMPMGGGMPFGSPFGCDSMGGGLGQMGGMQMMMMLLQLLMQIMQGGMNGGMGCGNPMGGGDPFGGFGGGGGPFGGGGGPFGGGGMPFGGGGVPFGGGNYGGNYGGNPMYGGNPNGAITAPGANLGGNASVDMARQYLGRNAIDIRGSLPNFTAAGGQTNNCADFVSSILQNTQRLRGHHVNVRGLEQQLRQQGWQQVQANMVRPGDVWISHTRSHTELVSGAGGTRTIGSNNDRPGHQVISEHGRRPGDGVYYQRIQQPNQYGGPQRTAQADTRNDREQPTQVAQVEPAGDTGSTQDVA